MDQLDLLFKEVVEKYGIPTLTKEYVGKTIAQITSDGFIVFTDNTCILYDEQSIVCDQDEYHPITYLQLWKKKYPYASHELENLMRVHLSGKH